MFLTAQAVDRAGRLPVGGDRAAAGYFAAGRTGRLRNAGTSLLLPNADDASAASASCRGRRPLLAPRAAFGGRS